MAKARPFVVRWRQMIWSATGPSLTARAVGAGLAMFMRPDGTPYVDADQIAIGVNAGCSTRSVRKALVELEQGGWIGVARETFRGGDQGQAWRKNTYWLTIPRGAEAPASPSHQAAEYPASPLPEGAEECSGKVGKISPNTTKRTNKTVYLPEFEKVWAAYPKKVGKLATLRVWKATRKRGVDAETLIRAASRYAAVCKSKGTEQEFIKHPSTFFGQDEWWRDHLADSADATRDSEDQSRAEIAAYRARGVSNE